MLDHIYLITKRSTEDYTQLPQCGVVKFLFTESELRCPNFHLAWARLLRDVAQGKHVHDDRMIFNGPGWLNAIAGHFWWTMQGTNSTRQLIYDSKRGVYQDHNYSFDEVFPDA